MKPIDGCLIIFTLFLLVIHVVVTSTHDTLYHYFTGYSITRGAKSGYLHVGSKTYRNTFDFYRGKELK